MKNAIEFITSGILALIISILGIVCPNISVARIDNIMATSQGMTISCYGGTVMDCSHIDCPIHNGKYAVIYNSNLNSAYNFVGYVI